MAKILVKGESVYECDVCNRRVRVPTNRTGIEIVQRCIITSKCQGKLHRITLTKDINETPAFPPEVSGVQDWFPRQLLYTHTQTTQSAKWIVTHGLENKPNIYVYVNRYINGVLQVVEVTPKKVNVIDLNKIEITFDEAEQGLVQCIALASQNSSNPYATAGVVATNADVQLTTNSELTIATLSTQTTTSLMVNYSSPTSPTPVSIEYLSIGAPSVLSPWVGVKDTIINGKQYTVRSFNLLTTPLAPGFFQDGAVTNGSTVSFPSQPVGAGQVLILLANAPYAVVDRIYDKYVDISTIPQGGIPQMYYNAGALYASPTMIKATYPPIIVA